MTAIASASDVGALGFDAAGIAFNAALLMALGFPIAWGILTANARMVAWWRARHLPPSPASLAQEMVGGEATPFRWNGRTTRRSAGVVGFVLVILALDALVFYGSAPSGPPQGLLLWSTVGIVIMCIVALLYGVSSKTYVLDASGIHVQRGPWGNLDIRWPEVREIGLAKMPFSEWAAPFVTSDLPQMIVLRGQDGRTLGILQPRVEMPPKTAAPFELALRAHAASHTIPIHEVGNREVLTWRKPRRSRPPAQRVP